MIATDRQSAFDKVLAAVPFKGQVLTQTARFWFDNTADICPNHVLEYPDPNVVVGRRLAMLPIEMVVRDYMTGSTETSIWPMYQRGARLLYGNPLPDGLTKNVALPATILTPTTKGEINPEDGADAVAGDGHDAPITAIEIVERGLLSQAQWDELAALSLALFARGREIAARHGLILVDTKYEFGLDDSGTIVLADEIHTPDSSRYWLADSYRGQLQAGAEPESLDKEFLRLWLRQRCDPYKDPIPEIPPETLITFSDKYISLFETITGDNFQRPTAGSDIRQHVHDNLKAYLPEYF
jgi:phosphoribosylaminoimidazole-succinocarboxamide synthase